MAGRGVEPVPVGLRRRDVLVGAMSLGAAAALAGCAEKSEPSSPPGGRDVDVIVIGAGIVGPNAGDLISEVALAIEMGCDAADIGLTIHPHPTLSEMMKESVLDAYGRVLNA